MVCLVYSKGEEVSKALGEGVISLLGAKETERVGGRRRFLSGKTEIIELEGLPIFEERLDRLVETDLFIFLSRHRSSKGVASFTVHPLGNWSEKSEFGGSPMRLSVAAPWQMRDMLKHIKQANDTQTNVTYEATHHGPLLDVPSFFVEVGGSEQIGDHEYDILARAVKEHLLGNIGKDGKVAIGIGGTHYPDKFTRLALAGDYAFSHIMARHSCMYANMLEQGIKRSEPQAEFAVIDWKGISAPEREAAIRKLGEFGIEYIKV